MKRVLDDLKVEVEGPIKFLCENQATLSIAKNHVHHDRTKHIDIDQHFINEKIESNIIEIEYIPTRHQLADILTNKRAAGRPQDLADVSELRLLHGGDDRA